jgi:hypothetical protein
MKNVSKISLVFCGSYFFIFILPKGWSVAIKNHVICRKYDGFYYQPGGCAICNSR